MKTEPSSASVDPDAGPPKLEEKIGDGADPNPTRDVEEGDTGSNSESESSESESSSDDNDSDDDTTDSKENNNTNNDGMSEYERLRLERIERNQAQLRQLGLLNDTKVTGTSKKKPHRKSTSAPPQNPVAARRQPKREVKGKIITQEQLDLRTLVTSQGGGRRRSSISKKSSKNRCGTCPGCLRVDDCNTCVYCDLRQQGAKTRRCIFKACRNKDKKNKRKKPAKKEEDQQLEHADLCDVCQTGGDLILCDACPRAFHSNCHVPKIKKIPDEEEDWFCMECNPRSRLHGFLLALMPDTAKLVKVRVLEPPPKCMVCLDDCARERESIQCKACDNHFHLTCQTPPLETKPKGGAARIWKCGACTQANAPILKQYAAAATRKTPTKKNLKLFEGEHDDDCYICINGGELVCCDFCPKVFHPACHIPALPAIPTGIWKCCECYASERNRMTRCGECKACMAQDCGKCKFCLDRPKFGGPNKLKKPCVRRECPYQSFAETFVAGKIPGEITHSSASSSKKKKKRPRDSDASQGNNKKRAKKEPAA